MFFPAQVCQVEKEESDAQHNPPSPVTPADHSHFRTIHRQASFDMENANSPASVAVVRPEPQFGTTSSVPREVLHSSKTQLDSRVAETHVVTLQFTDDSQPWTAAENRDRVRCIDNKAETSDTTRPTNTIHDNGVASTIVPIESTETRDSYIVAGDSKSQASSRVTFSEVDAVKYLEAETVINTADLITTAPKPIAQSSQDNTGEPEEEAELETFQTNQNAESAELTPTLEAIIKSEDQMLLVESSKSTDPQDKRKGTKK